MPLRPQLFSIIDRSIEKDQPLPFLYADEEGLIVLPPEYIGLRAKQCDAIINDQQPPNTELEFMTTYGEEIAQRMAATNMDVHLIINSSEGSSNAWLNYAKTLAVLRALGSNITAHGLNRVGDLAADIYIQQEKQTALQDSNFQFEAGDRDETALRQLIEKQLAKEQLPIDEAKIAHTIDQQREGAEIAWQNIRAFLLSQPGSPHKKHFKQLLETAENNPPRTLAIDGNELGKASPLIKVYGSLREMFDSFCQRTGIEFESLPLNHISRIFTIAAVETEIEQKTGVKMAISADDNEDNTSGLTFISYGTEEEFKDNEQEIGEIITKNFIEQPFSKAPALQ